LGSKSHSSRQRKLNRDSNNSIRVALMMLSGASAIIAGSLHCLRALETAEATIKYNYAP
jgi:hypothetical protein